MTLADWRTRPAAEIARCYDAERASWAQRYGWDTAENWRQVEQARVLGTLPGLVALEPDGPVGWTFFLTHRRTLQIGTLSLCPRGPAEPSAASAAATLDRLIDGILVSPEAAAADAVMTFTPDIGDGLAAALSRRGFHLQAYQYLHRTLAADAIGETLSGAVSFHAGRLAALADLLARAYPGASAARPFAPGGTAAEWGEYAIQLVTQNGCGTLLPWASVVEEEPRRHGHLIGAVLATRIGPQSAHLAQVAVDPAWQGQGRGRRLVQGALARLAKRGYTRVSLLVASGNAPARALYAGMGFVASGEFLSGWCPWAAARVSPPPPGAAGAPADDA